MQFLPSRINCIQGTIRLIFPVLQIAPWRRTVSQTWTALIWTEQKKGKSTTFWIILIAGIAAVVVVGVVIVVVVTYKKVKKNKGVIYVDGKATLASNVDVKQHVSVVNLPQKTVTFLMKDQINGKCELKVTINGSAMAGRSDDCDIYFDDPKMSRQHFALETDGNDVYITDLRAVTEH